MTTLALTSPARAIVWEVGRRHRWGLAAVIAYLIVLAAIKVLFSANDIPIAFDSAVTFAFGVVVPSTAYFTYFIAIFTFGLDGDIAARPSLYPARMFTRPVSTAALAGWPMLLGGVAAAVLWTATRLLALWPSSSVEVPVVWPGILAVALLAWAQAFTWMPYGLPGVRVLAMVLWLTVIDAIVILALHFEVSEAVMAAFLLPQIPLAYLIAQYAVARARRGDVPDWSGAFTWLARLTGRATIGRNFRTAAGAQAWLEWRVSGKSLPVWVAMVLPFELLLFWVVGTSTVLLIEFILGALLAPVVIATFAATTASKPRAQVSASYGVSAFIATRPLTNAQIIAAKLKTTLASTVLAWLLVIAALPIALEWSGVMPLAQDRTRRVVEAVGTPRATVFLMLVLTAFVVSTWRQLVQTLYVGLTGRAGLIKGSIFVTLSLLVLLGATLEWTIETGRIWTLWNALPLVCAVLVGAKMSAAAWIATRLHRHRLVSDRALVTGAACWSAVVFALYGVLVWMLDTPHIPRYVLMMLAILAIPLARVSAAPLALAWNRHR